MILRASEGTFIILTSKTREYPSHIAVTLLTNVCDATALWIVSNHPSRPILVPHLSTGEARLDARSKTSVQVAFMTDHSGGGISTALALEALSAFQFVVNNYGAFDGWFEIWERWFRKASVHISFHTTQIGPLAKDE